MENAMAERSGYLKMAARLAGVAGDSEKLNVERLRWQGIPLEDEDDKLWEILFVRSRVDTREFFKRIDERAERGLRLAPFEGAFDAAFRRSDDPPPEVVLYQRLGADHGDLFEIVEFGGLLAESAIPTEHDLEEPDTIMSAALAASPVALGVIDDRVPLLNPRFWDMSGESRIVSFFAQNWGGPGTVFGGTILGSTAIKNRISRLQGESEDVLYRHLTTLFLGPLTRHSLHQRASHGAHMLDLAGGIDPSSSDPIQQVPVHVVQLPPRVYDDTSGYSLAVPIVAGLRWLMLQAVLEGAADTLVVNISLGPLAGPKNGQSWLEQQIASDVNKINEVKSLEVVPVFPHGNDYDSRLVARKKLAAGESTEFTLRVQPDDLTPSYVELRASPLGAFSDVSKIELTLTSSTGDVFGPTSLPAGTSLPMTDSAGRDIATVFHEALVSTTVPDPIPSFLLIALFPTRPLTPGEETSPSGAWRIRVRNTDAADGDGDFMDLVLQVQSDFEPFPRRTGARQAYLDDETVHGFNPLTRNFNGHSGSEGITHKGTNTSYSTTPVARSVGGALVRESDIGPARYTSESADSADWSGVMPAAGAVSEIATATRGVRASGVKAHATASVSGSSTAAATYSRRLVMERLGMPLPVTAIPADPRLGTEVVTDNPAIRKV
jgi:hypothetical protein